MGKYFYICDYDYERDNRYADNDISGWQYRNIRKE
jgi:hypothetical protein